VAVGVGVVIARTGRDRRRTQRRKREQELGLRPGEPLPEGLRRMALGQVELALEALGATGEPPSEKAVHETRKAIKRLRALLGLLRQELGERGFRRENAALRDVARQLSGARDAAVMLATLDALIERHPRKLGRRRGVLALRRRLAAESDRVQRLMLADAAARAEVLGELHSFRWRVAAWSLPAAEGMRLVDADLERLYRQGRARRRRAIRAKGERTLAMHRWRKRVKDIRYAAEMLDPGDGNAPLSRKTGRRGKSRRSRKPRYPMARLRKLAEGADDLGELLGEEHDLALLDHRLRAGGRGGARRGADELWHTRAGTRKALLKLIARRRRQLRRQALRKGERLYGEKPRRFMRGVRTAYADGAAHT
jgi:CHAD domain-containing protein